MHRKLSAEGAVQGFMTVSAMHLRHLREQRKHLNDFNVFSSLKGKKLRVLDSSWWNVVSADLPGFCSSLTPV